MPSLKLFNNFIEKQDIDFLIKWIDNNCHDQKKFRHRVGIAFDKGLAVRAIFPDEKPPSMFKDLECDSYVCGNMRTEVVAIFSM